MTLREELHVAAIKIADAIADHHENFDEFRVTAGKTTSGTWLLAFDTRSGIDERHAVGLHASPLVAAEQAIERLSSPAPKDGA